MEVMQAIRGRRTVRSYTNEPVSDAEVGALIDAAVQAPSAMNQQPWSFCVVRDQNLLDQVATKAKAFMLADDSGTLPDTLRQALSRDDFHIFYKAPALIVISTIEAGPWGPIDCTLAAQNLMLAAYYAGLGSGWIGLAQAWLGTPEGKAALNIPASHSPVAPIIVGHPAETPAPVQRKSPPVTWVQ